MNNGSKLYFYYGTVAAGKSLRLLATAYNFEDHKIPFLVMKSEIDTRDGVGIIHSRALGDRECTVIGLDDDIVQKVRNVQSKQILTGQEPIEWILVDEAQFLSPEQVEQLGAIVDKMDVSVMCFGLRTDFKSKLFPGSKRLFEIADTLEEIKSNCDCNAKNIFNARITKDGSLVTNGAQVEIGGDERYRSMCRQCYFEKTGHPLYSSILYE